MKLNRRNFLRGAIASPLAKMVSASEGEKTMREEPCDGKFMYDLAIYSLDIANEYLEALINKEYTGPHQTYASNIDSATKFIHFGVWRECCSINKVQKNYIPLLKKARNSIDLNDPKEIKKHDTKSTAKNSEYPRYAMHVKACITSRILNLERYLKGLNSDTEAGFNIIEKEGKYKFIKH